MQDINMQQKMADTIRFLAADMIQQANSGHPGAPMGLADIAVVLSKYLKHNPKDSTWLNRDRLVFSGGHATGLIYSLLHLWGYDVSMDDIKNFRQTDSKTAGHPEYGHTDGIEITTGPLGQGVANAVGFAMASKYASKLLNSETAKVIDHKVYCLCGDGDLQEGISYEACSIAGHNNLDNLVLIYDSNEITIEGSTSLSWSEDITKRFEAQGFDVISIDGHSFDEIDSAFVKAQTQTKPLLIIAHTKIAKGAVTLEGSHHSHGAPLGEDEILNSKIKAGLLTEKFHIDEDVLARFRCAIEKGDLAQREWKKLLLELPLSEQNETLKALSNSDFSKIEYPEFEVGSSVATRDSNGKIINAIAKAVPSFIGGSADLSPSNKTYLNNFDNFPNGRNIYFGIREHAMASITNAIALYGLFKPFTSTFFVFSDYLKPAVRIAALANIPQYFIWTHDSIGVGEDGPTHQPIEHLTQFRALPNFYLFRPADANENIECWKSALELKKACGFVCSRQKLPTLDTSNSYGDVSKGAYIVDENCEATITLIATGSEVSLALEAAKKLTEDGYITKVVSVPCFDLFIEQSKEYQSSIVNPSHKVIAIEAARGLEWYRFADEVIGMDSFGASGKADELFEKFGFSVENIVKRVKEI
jgi:transketolase